MTPAALADLVRSAAVRALGTRGLDPAVVPDEVDVRPARRAGQGDYATSVALRLAGPVGVDAREVAAWVAAELAVSDEVVAEVAGPGFVNLRLVNSSVGEVLRSIHEPGGPVDRELPERVRTRTHGTVTMAGLVELVGADAARYAVLSGKSTVDTEVWGRHVDRNPVYNVQYAHSRAFSLARNANDLGITLSQQDGTELLDHPRELDLVRALRDFAPVADPRALTRAVEDVAEAFHRFTHTCRVLPSGDEEPTPRHHARVALCVATRRVLASGLGLLGVTAPERM
ncbi:DALR anticodon-binding domain-containing protein [Actinokineospora enzanensis]|uniref:DALR anticodon-binding domain-containing protein n=1 Tax=Actinokineospora enzanensis TaxID=155975 RepID=UPI00036BE0C9|nr:arginine--tRNA ligase [Actinokineospora enzanensis]